MIDIPYRDTKLIPEQYFTVWTAGGQQYAGAKEARETEEWKYSRNDSLLSFHILFCHLDINTWLLISLSIQHPIVLPAVKCHFCHYYRRSPTYNWVSFKRQFVCQFIQKYNFTIANGKHAEKQFISKSICNVHHIPASIVLLNGVQFNPYPANVENMVN